MLLHLIMEAIRTSPALNHYSNKCLSIYMKQITSCFLSKLSKSMMCLDLICGILLFGTEFGQYQNKDRSEKEPILTFEDFFLFKHQG